MAQQIAVEWLEETIKQMIYNGGDLGEDESALMEHIKQAKQIEKEQMRKCASFWRGKENEIEKPIFEQYYNETYNK